MYNSLESSKTILRNIYLVLFIIIMMFYEVIIQSLDKIAVLLMIILFLLDYRPFWRKRDKSQVQRKVPGPISLPVLGTRWLLYSGRYELSKIHEFYNEMHKKYGPIFKEESFFNVPIYNIFDRADIEKVLKAPSKYPIRPPTEAEVIYRQSRPDRYASAGLVNEQGKTWYSLRTSLTTRLMSPKTMSDFHNEACTLAEDWCSYLRAEKGSDGYIANLNDIVIQLCIETTCDLVLGRRLGFMCQNVVSQKAIKLANALQDHFISLRDTQFSLPFWKYFQTGPYKTMVDCENFIYETVLEMVKDFSVDNEEGTVYSSILNARIDEREKTAAIIDFISAGVHTLKNSLMFLLYLVAKHPDTQDKIVKDINYAKACMTESFRVLPSATPLARILEQDMDIAGYPLKAGSVILCHSAVASKKNENFVCANEFRPERWLGNDGMKTVSTSTFLVTPFGAGRRICPGKRFIELVLPIFLQETVKNFQLSTNHVLELQYEFLMSPKGAISMTFTDRF